MIVSPCTITSWKVCFHEVGILFNLLFWWQNSILLSVQQTIFSRLARLYEERYWLLIQFFGISLIFDICFRIVTHHKSEHLFYGTSLNEKKLPKGLNISPPGVLICNYLEKKILLIALN